MKINLFLKCLLPCIAGIAVLISPSLAHAADVTVGSGETYTVPGTNSQPDNQENVTAQSGATIDFVNAGHLEGNIVMEDGSKLHVGTGATGVLWTGTNTTFSVSGTIIKEGTGSVRIDRPITSYGDSTLDITVGSIDFGDNTNDNGALGFTHVIVRENTTFNWKHSGNDVGKFTLDGGTYKHLGQNTVGITMSELDITRDSSFDVQATGTYDITTLTGSSSLSFKGIDNQLNFNVDTIENYNGNITAANVYHDIKIKNINQAEGNTVTISDVDGIEASEGLVKQGAGVAIMGSDLAVTGDMNVQGGTLQLNGSATVTGSVTGAAGSSIVVGDSGSLSLDDASYSLTGGSISAAANAATYSLTGDTITGANLSGLTITVSDSSDLTLSNVTLDKNTTISLGSGSTYSLEDSILTGLTITNDGLKDFANDDFTAKDLQTYSITGITDILDIHGVSDTLTLDLGVLDATNGFVDPSADGKMFGFILDDASIDSLSDLVTGGLYGDIELIINGNTYSVLGATQGRADGSIMLYIPEPSTASLSILALAGLLARRRRKS